MKTVKENKNPSDANLAQWPLPLNEWSFDILYMIIHWGIYEDEESESESIKFLTNFRAVSQLFHDMLKDKEHLAGIDSKFHKFLEEMPYPDHVSYFYRFLHYLYSRQNPAIKEFLQPFFSREAMKEKEIDSILTKITVLPTIPKDMFALLGGRTNAHKQIKWFILEKKPSTMNLLEPPSPTAKKPRYLRGAPPQILLWYMSINLENYFSTLWAGVKVIHPDDIDHAIQSSSYCSLTSYAFTILKGCLQQSKKTKQPLPFIDHIPLGADFYEYLIVQLSLCYKKNPKSLGSAYPEALLYLFKNYLIATIRDNKSHVDAILRVCATINAYIASKFITQELYLILSYVFTFFSAQTVGSWELIKYSFSDPFSDFIRTLIRDKEEYPPQEFHKLLCRNLFAFLENALEGFTPNSNVFESPVPKLFKILIDRLCKDLSLEEIQIWEYFKTNPFLLAHFSKAVSNLPQVKMELLIKFLNRRVLRLNDIQSIDFSVEDVKKLLSGTTHLSLVKLGALLIWIINQPEQKKFLRIIDPFLDKFISNNLGMFKDLSFEQIEKREGLKYFRQGLMTKRWDDFLSWLLKIASPEDKILFTYYLKKRLVEEREEEKDYPTLKFLVDKFLAPDWDAKKPTLLQAIQDYSLISLEFYPIGTYAFPSEGSTVDQLQKELIKSCLNLLYKIKKFGIGIELAFSSNSENEVGASFQEKLEALIYQFMTKDNIIDIADELSDFLKPNPRRSSLSILKMLAPFFQEAEKKTQELLSVPKMHMPTFQSF